MKNTIGSFVNFIDSASFFLFKSSNHDLQLDLLLASSNSDDENGSRGGGASNTQPGGPSSPQPGGPSNTQPGGPSNTEGNNLGTQNPQTPSDEGGVPSEGVPSEDGVSSDDDGYASDSEVRRRFNIDPNNFYQFYNEEPNTIPEAELRRLADLSAAECRNLTQNAVADEYMKYRLELEESHGRKVGLEEYFREELERRRERHKEYVDEIGRRKTEGLIADSPPGDYDTKHKHTVELPSFAEILAQTQNQSGETSAAGASNNTVNPSAESSNVQPTAESSNVEASAPLNPTNPSSEDINPSPRPGFWQTIFGSSNPSPTQNEYSTVDGTSNNNKNEEKTTKSLGEAPSSNEQNLEVGESSTKSSKTKFEEEEGESSTQPSKKFKQDSSDIKSDTEPFDFGGGDD